MTNDDRTHRQGAARIAESRQLGPSGQTAGAKGADGARGPSIAVDAVVKAPYSTSTQAGASPRGSIRDSTSRWTPSPTGPGIFASATWHANMIMRSMPELPSTSPTPECLGFGLYREVLPQSGASARARCSSATASAVARACGSHPRAARNASRSRVRVATGVVAIPVAVRGMSRTSAISPKAEPACPVSSATTGASASAKSAPKTK
jgi:hypothetical protein